jgi:hypothetical protein
VGQADRSDGREVPPHSRGAQVGCLAVLPLDVGVLVLVPIDSWGFWRERNRAPRPDGLILQVERREVVSPFDGFGIVPIERDGPAVAILDAGTTEFPPTLIVVRYPSGEILERLCVPNEAGFQAVGDRRWPKSALPFDLDGDGTADVLVDGPQATWGAPT